MSRITEKRIYRIPPIALTSDGTNVGHITVPDSSLFMVGQIVILNSSATGPMNYKINRIHPVDHVTMELGPVKEHISKRSDLSAFLVADGATIEANEQERPSVPEQEIERHTYEEEPTVARRVILVDKWGCRIDDNNPLPTTAVLNVGNLEIPVEIDAKDGDNIAISAHPNQIFSQNEDTLTTAAFKEIFSYTSTDDNTKVAYLSGTVNTPTVFRVYVDGVFVRERMTSPGDRNADFVFYEHRSLPTGTTITVEAKPFRNICPPYGTFVSMEGYIA